MFKMISWPQFLGAVAVLLVLYYVFVVVVYYRTELLGLMKGKGRAVGDESLAPTPASVLGKVPLVSKAAAIVLPKQEAPAAAQQVNEQEPAEVVQETTTSLEAKEADEIKENDLDISIESNNDETIISGNSVPNQERGEELEEFEHDYTVGVAQLSDYFDRAAEGEITQEQLVEEIPALENTEVLMAFYKKSSKSAQQLTSTLYADVVEPAVS
ncbi:hypothetical protein [Hymenobacter cavernae]|uniref:Conjugal transfer protein TraD n=1 Tax=Hymenobacter cavernae TaxID=2044852 RepID=A0ABQ1UX03_9BACT|nr:hypothetical protein [Hymenobacter cavernae]GGF27215.1 hypothetical protein GCM10011383_43560 [Hymenobacter cavernae]